MRSVVVSFSLAGLMLLGCSSRHELDKPTPPNLQPLLDAYSSPTGTIDQKTFDSVKQTVFDRQSLLDQAEVDQLFTDALDVSLAGAADAGAADAGKPVDVPKFEGDGYVTVTRICGGWGNAVPDKANGSMRFTMTFSEKGPDPVVWGTFSDCTYSTGGAHVRVGAGKDGQTGQMSADFGHGLSFSGYDGSPVLFSANVLAEVDGQPYTIDFDFRITPNTREIELRVPVQDGDVIIELSTASFLGIRAGNGIFTCDSSTQTCTAKSGASISF